MCNFRSSDRAPLCLKRFRTKLNFNEARDQCRHYGAYLINHDLQSVIQLLEDGGSTNQAVVAEIFGGNNNLTVQLFSFIRICISPVFVTKKTETFVPILF